MAEQSCSPYIPFFLRVSFWIPHVAPPFTDPCAFLGISYKCFLYILFFMYKSCLIYIYNGKFLLTHMLSMLDKLPTIIKKWKKSSWRSCLFNRESNWFFLSFCCSVVNCKSIIKLYICKCISNSFTVFWAFFSN